MLVGRGIYLVTSGALGHNSTHALDCSSFAVEAEGGWLLFDTGAGVDLARVDTALGELPGPVTHVFLTHCHADHAGGAAHLRRRGARIIAGPETSAIVAAGDEHAMSLDVARALGVYPADYRFEPCVIDDVLSPDSVAVMGGRRIRMVATPGHSADHVSYVVEDPEAAILMAGDALFEGGTVVLQDTWDCNVQATCRTIERLAEIDFEVFLPGHGPLRLNEAREPVRQAMARVKSLLCPRPFL
jgi:glyoxylase-like metal-dependent hydrolase (beta-lactamase superfamily II)